MSKLNIVDCTDLSHPPGIKLEMSGWGGHGVLDVRDAANLVCTLCRKCRGWTGSAGDGVCCRHQSSGYSRSTARDQEHVKSSLR